MKNTSMDMCQGPLFGKIIRYSVPIMLTGVLQLLFNAADLVVVGRFCGSLSVAAVGATSSLTNLIVNLFIGLGSGISVVVAQSIGAKNDAGVSRTVHTAVPTALICGVFLTIVGVTCSGTFLQWMSTPEDVIGLSTLYMQLYFCGILFTVLYNFCAAILRAAGDTKSPLLYLTVAGVVNVVLNVIFVTLFHMNVAGVALATTISQGISALLVLRALMRRTDACRLELRKMKIYKKTLLHILRLGIPTGLQSCLFSISNVIIQSSINSFGSVVVSGNAAALNVEQFVWIIVDAFHHSALTFTGQNYGAGEYKRIRKVVRICLGCALVVGIVVGGAACLFAEPLVSVYITDSQQAVQYAVLRLLCICPGYFFAGLMDTINGVIRGLGHAFASMVISVIGICGLRVGWVFTIFQIPAYHSPQSLYLSYSVSWVLTFAAMMITYFIAMASIQRKNAHRLKN